MTNFFYLVRCLHPQSTLFPYTTLFRSDACHKGAATSQFQTMSTACSSCHVADFQAAKSPRSEEHTSELQSHVKTVCRLLLENKKGSLIISLTLTEVSLIFLKATKHGMT